MLVYLTLVAAAIATDHSKATAASIGVALAGALLGAAYAAYRREDADTEPGRLDDVLPPAGKTPVEHTGADETWSPAEEVAAQPHPLDTSVPLVFGDDLVPAHFFEDMMTSDIRVDLGWAPPTASQAWELAGVRLAELGDTQTFEAVLA